MTKPICNKCGVILTPENIATKENGTIRLDCTRKPWCKKCTEEHDKIEWR